jgi:hypothetical protein
MGGRSASLLAAPKPAAVAEREEAVVSRKKMAKVSVSHDKEARSRSRSPRLSSAADMCEDEAEADMPPMEESAPIVAAAPIQRGTVSEVLQQQKFGGNFALDAAFARVLGASLAALDAALAPARLAPLDGGDVKSVWATLLALAALEKHYGASRGVWEMVAEKAIAWLTTLLKGKGLDKKAARVKVDELVAIAKSTI